MRNRISLLFFLAIGLTAPVENPCSAAETNRDEMLRARDAVHWSSVPKQVLAFYYGWYGNPSVSGKWVHWGKVDEAKKRIGSSSHYRSEEHTSEIQSHS